MSPKVVYEGWMVRFGRRIIGRSFIHMRYFMLESGLLAYYKRKPQDNQDPIKTLLIDGNCRVEDRGLKTHDGHMVYVLAVYNKKEKNHQIMMAAFNIQDALIWKQNIEDLIDQHQGAQPSNGNQYVSLEYMDNETSSLVCESQFRAQEDEDETHSNLSVFSYVSAQDVFSSGIPFSAQEIEGEPRSNLLRRTTIGNGPRESIIDWTQEIFELRMSITKLSQGSIGVFYNAKMVCVNAPPRIAFKRELIFLLTLLFSIKLLKFCFDG